MQEFKAKAKTTLAEHTPVYLLNPLCGAKVIGQPTFLFYAL